MRISFKVVSCVAFCALLFTMASQARATLLTGTSVTGSLTFGASANLFDPTTGAFGTSVPSADLNHAGTTVTIDPVATEFGASSFGVDTADFTDNTLTVTQRFAYFGTAVYTFTDTAFAGLTLTETSSVGPLTGSLVGDTLTVSAPNATLGTAVFTFTPSAAASVPEPAPFVVGCVGIPALLGWAAWKKRKSTAV